MKPLRMPRSLDDQMYVLFWTADEMLPGLFIFIVGVLIAQKLICLVLAIVVIKVFRRMKEFGIEYVSRPLTSPYQ